MKAQPRIFFFSLKVLTAEERSDLSWVAQIQKADLKRRASVFAEPQTAV